MPATVIFIIILGIVIGAITVFLARSYIIPKRVAGIAALIRQGKNAAASRMARQIIAREPRSGDAHYLLGLAYLGENKHELALMELKTVNEIATFGEITPEAAFRRQIAALFERFGQPEEALKEYLLLMKLEPEEAEHTYRAGILFEERGKPEMALNYFHRTIELNARHPDAHYRLGALLYRMQRPVEAKAELENAIRLQPENFRAYFYLGRLLKENHDYVGALVALEKAQRDPEHKVKALVERGACYLSMNNFDKAVSELERAIKLGKNDTSPEILYARYFLAHCYEKMRVLDKAVENWERIYERKPGFRDVAEKLSHYQELRTDDRMKEYLTASHEEFQEICRSLTIAMGLSPRDITDISNGCQVIAVEDESKWRNARKLPKLLRFLRVPDVIQESTTRSIHEEMKRLGVNRSIVIASTMFSRKAIEFAETRPIDLVNRDQLQELLKKVEFSWAKSGS